MKKFITWATIATFALTLTSCAGREDVCGISYSSYGVANSDTEKNPNINYEVSTRNVILAILFSETIIVPVVVVGWYLFIPVSQKDTSQQVTGVVKSLPCH